MRLRTVAAALLLAAGLLGTAACTSDAAPTGGTAPAPTGGSAPVPTGGTAPAPAAGSVPETLSFDGKTLDGKPFRGASLAGRPVVLWFWAPWCGTCAGQSAVVSDVAAKYGGRVSVVGVAGLGKEKEMHEFVSDTEVGAVTHLNDEAGAVWRRFKVTEQSTYIFLDRAGSVVHRGWLDSIEFTERVAALAG